MRQPDVLCHFAASIVIHRESGGGLVLPDCPPVDDLIWN
jgi:hypothetical protein